MWTKWLLPVALVLLATARASDAEQTCESPTKGLKNSAFVFVKPHANTEKTLELVQKKLTEAGITIISETDIDGETIDSKGLIDQHYYSIASKATILAADKIPVPEDKFEEAFGESWKVVLKENRACNALEACRRFECSPTELNEVWQKVDAIKFGGGFYCAPLSVNGKSELYVFNAFFMEMRQKFVGKEHAIHCYVVEWDPKKLSWTSFRNEVLGPTDPSQAPDGSIRRAIFEKYEKLGLSAKPTKGDNGVHASASPLEGLAEKSNWLGLDNLNEDNFGLALLKAGIPASKINAWFKDPQIKLSSGSSGSVFDAVEELDAEDCLQQLIDLNHLN